MCIMTRHVTLAAVVAVLAACHQVQPSVSPTAGLVGRYIFREELPAPSTTGGHSISGELQILADSFIVESERGPCQQQILKPSPTSVQFTCPDFSVEINRRDPLQKSKYFAATEVTVHPSECTRYAYGENGTRICVEQGNTTKQKTVVRTGRVHFHSLKRERHSSSLTSSMAATWARASA